MNTLADMAFEYIWLMMFGNETQIDPDYSVSVQESLSLYLDELSPEERTALSEAARRTRDVLLAEPDEYGYAPRSLVTEEQKVMLEAFIAQDVYG